MGRAKEWMMEQEARGYSEADGEICSECVSDKFLAEWIDANAEATTRTFCGREDEEPIAASFDEFVGVVLAGISFEWNHPDNEGIMYVSAEGGYQASVSDIYDVLSDIEITENEDVSDALVDAIEDNGWVEREFYIGDKSRRLSWGWDSFKRVTKHQTRYLFLNPKADEQSDFPASQMLGTIARIMAADLEEYEFIKTVSTDTDLIRIRIGPEAYTKATEIGSPPEEWAVQPNRMSPAGVPMFYGAYDVATAKAETLDPVAHAGKILSIGTFRPVRDLRVLDIADLPDIPSVFDSERHYLRVMHSLQPTQLAELWIENSGEYVGGPDRIDDDRISFALWVNDVDVAVVASGCRDAELPGFAACQRFRLKARDLSSEVDLRGGQTIESIDASLFDLMDQIFRTYPAAPRRW